MQAWQRWLLAVHVLADGHVDQAVRYDELVARMHARYDDGAFGPVIEEIQNKHPYTRCGVEWLALTAEGAKQVRQIIGS